MTLKISFSSIVFPLVLIILGVLFFVNESFGREHVQEKVQFETRTLPKSELAAKNKSLASNLKSSYEEEYKVFETDFPKRRRKRFIYYNVDSNLDVGFLVVIPITVVVPSMSNIFNKWRRRRSVRDLNEIEDNFEDHPLVQPHLDRISTYFELLDIPEHHCQLRAVCEFSAEPSKYFPLSDMILGRLRNPSIPASIAYEVDENSESVSINSTLDGESKPKSLFRKYNQAADTGLASGTDSCEKNYGQRCKYNMEKLLSMTALRIWRAMRSKIGFNIKDDFTI